MNGSPTTLTTPISLLHRLRCYFQLAKPRLTSLVLFSGGIAYAVGSTQAVRAGEMVLFLIAAALVTASANAINQILEVRWDAQMRRTQSRPLPSGKLQAAEVMVYALICGSVGVLMLISRFGLLSGCLALLSLWIYAFAYTPAKRVGVLAVYVGAIPGALPLLIGYAAGAGHLAPTAWLLFAMQIAWQFPHFWAIAWLAEEDYSRAGFSLLPSQAGRGKVSARWIVGSSLVLLGVGVLPTFLGLSGLPLLISASLVGLIVILASLRLLFRPSLGAAKGVMYASFLYLPTVLLAHLFTN